MHWNTTTEGNQHEGGLFQYLGKASEEGSYDHIAHKTKETNI